MKKVLKIVGLAILGFIVLVGLYLLVERILSRIAVDREPTVAEMDIYIMSNGVHTDLVLPITNDVFDWRRDFKPENTTGKDTTVNWVALGWGDKGFYLETPTWNDLKFSTAFNALFGLSNTAIHATFHHDLKESERCKKIRISKVQYEKLIRFVHQSLTPGTDSASILIKTNANYGTHDAFYEANGAYSMFYTCNTWTNHALKVCGQKAAVFTLFDSGILYHYK